MPQIKIRLIINYAGIIPDSRTTKLCQHDVARQAARDVASSLSLSFSKFSYSPELDEQKGKCWKNREANSRARYLWKRGQCEGGKKRVDAAKEVV